MEKQIGEKRNLSWIMHILIFLMVYCLPFVMNPRHSSFNPVDYLGYCIPMTAYVLIFYLNFYLFINKFLFTKKIGSFILINVGTMALLAFILIFWGDFYFAQFVRPLIPENPMERHWDGDFIQRGQFYRHCGMFFRDFMFMFITVCIATAFKTTLEWYRMDREKARMEAVASQAELKNLKSQLNPHFLFNSLNSIYSLMRVDTEKAQDAVLGLSKILRYVLSGDNQDKVMLRDDIAFMRNYIDLMSLRLAKNVTLTTEIADFSASTATIAPLLFISLVENAFKHGISPAEPSFIDIHIVPSGDEICCTVRNSSFPKIGNDYSGSGIGLENLRKRLNLLYPGKHIYTCKSDNGEYSVTLKVSLE